MPKIRCKCNQIISLSGIPSADQFMIISDTDFDKLEEKEVLPMEIYMKMEVVAKCPNCGRLHVFWDGADNPQKIYKPED